MNENMKRWLKNAGCFVVIIGTSALTLWVMSLIAGKVGESTAGSALNELYSGIIAAERYEEIDISEAGEPYREIARAYRAEKDGETTGYIIEMVVDGYGGDMEVTVGVSADAKRVTGVKVGANSETEGLGSRVAENSFLSQFTNAAVPLEVGSSALTDGTYFAQADEYDGGYKHNMTITVENGLITHAVWDAESESGGKSKRQASIDGEYVMTADGLLWHEQAQLLEARLIEVQDPSKIAFGDDGKTDAIAGVSIKINSFVTLAQQCCTQAGGASDYTAIDGVSGATVSSKAVVGAANTAVEFTDKFLLLNGETIAADVSGSDIYE